LHKAKSIAPDKNEVHYLLSLVYFRQGEALWQTEGADKRKALAHFEKAAASAREVLAAKPGYGFAHMSLGLALKFLGRRKEAIQELRQAAHCNPEYAEIHLMLGSALAEEGHAREARHHLEQAALLAGPNDPRPREALGRLSDKGKSGDGP
jgi:tetratricopeptide (TPR) repeat protein